MTDDLVALTIKASGIHPSTSRAIIIDALSFDEDGQEVGRFYAVLNPGTDPGPTHLHGLSHEQVQHGKRFSHILKPLGRFIDGKTLIVHNAPTTWGFIVSEARRAMSSAARANRARGRNRRRQRVGHIPVPEKIIDTLATARRQGLDIADTRIRSVAQALGVESTPAHASLARAAQKAAETIREETRLCARIYFVEDARGEVVSMTPDSLCPDRFGLQRSEIRVDAMNAPRPFTNPGVYSTTTGLVQGMEVVITPEITADPDELIAAAVREGLAYSEKITRASSVVVCNKKADWTGKAMHAMRKGIPLLSDTEFLDAVTQVAPGVLVHDS
ncbi:DNA polymerase III subunit epsilon [Corynebacterium sp. sy017]|uniref:BRCT domain-containing protein n=1 Tax=unclassified Corynebacterium TaxID=2624378 RepID=UPI001186C80D|nr:MULTISPECIES: BRCT domain-containing protein [unclassified Corynebacterium]MBP3089425.1 DNA polymerase III subunit epsilon [Corynebacterium sp. sy017]QDZ43348.1 DNA polymerase III subunit epsilon [Corynebacterium sp. sy039]TSD90889.1 DNA polymerase III subunit epsilon [Corynebacterium sp. SY003]